MQKAMDFTEVKTPQGAVRGVAIHGQGHDVYGFYGVAYAQPPVGKLRWRAAEEKTPWEGVLDCTLPLTRQPSAYQWGNNLLAYFKTLNQSEDCLYLNITTPHISKTQALPVIVWFHGGGLFGGSGSEEVYNLPILPGKGCVLVTVSTRLGAFGVLSADLLEGTNGNKYAGNFILSDMLEALRWVKRNIASFGGDPNNVTIAGESGGSHKVSALLAVPQARGLFQRAIMQSGIASAVSGEQALDAGNRLMKQLSVQEAAQARALPAEVIVRAYNELELATDFIVDGDYLPQAPLDAIRMQAYWPCDVLLGVNAGEIGNLLSLIGSIPQCVTLLDCLRRDGCSAYVYQLDQVPSTWRSLGFQCVHSLDIAYLFGEYEDTHRYYSGGPWEQQFMFHGAGKRLNPEEFIAPEMDAADRLLSDTMMELWISFARDGTPKSKNCVWQPWSEKQEYLHLSTMDGQNPHMRKGFGALNKMRNPGRSMQAP